MPKPTRRTREHNPFAGYTHKPECALCDHGMDSQPQEAPGAPPPRMIFIRGRRRHVDTTRHVCPQASCADHGWVGFGNIRANGHPNGRRWRQLHCRICHGYFLETHGTPFHGKQVDPDKLVWAVAALAEGLGIRAVARVFEVDRLWCMNRGNTNEINMLRFSRKMDKGIVPGAPYFEEVRLTI